MQPFLARALRGLGTRLVRIWHRETRVVGGGGGGRGAIEVCNVALICSLQYTEKAISTPKS